MTRRALLIGIDSYQESALSLSAPKTDVMLLGRVLERAGFPAGEVEQLIGSQTVHTLSGNTLRKLVRNFFGSATPDQELLLYLSGHGIEQGGHRVIVPSDYYLDDPAPQPIDTVVGDQYLYSEARRSAARSILVILDCCREGWRLTLARDKPVAKAVPAADPVHAEPADTPTVAIVYSCRSDEQSYADPKAGGASYFTTALCRVLEEDNELSSLVQVAHATQQTLTGLLASADRTQTVTLDERPIRGRGGEPHRLLIKESRVARSRQSIADSLWCQDLEGCPWWPALEAGEPGLASQVKWITLCAEDVYRKAARALPAQRWRDRDAPGRVVRRLTSLLQRSADCLSPPETALALCVPYVYEAVLAAAELHLVENGDPLKPSAGTGGSRAWGALQGAFAAEEALARRRESLHRQQLSEAAEDLAAWQLTQFLHGSGELWSYRSLTTRESINWVTPALDALFTPAPFPETRRDERVSKLLQGRRLVRLARLAFSQREDIEFQWAVSGDERLQSDLLFGEGDQEWQVNEVAVAELLVLSFAMACDPRRMPLILAEHVGRPKEVVATSIREILNPLAWRWQGDALVADLECPLEVLDLTLQGVVDTLNLHRQRHRDDKEFPDMLAALPSAFSRERVGPALDSDGRPLYERPHLQLTYSQSRVRDLFMGQSLYGKPELALREMYQNALDACRYRQCRVRYLQATGQRVDDYTGRIEFRAGYHDGRAYIECRDNGVGMGERHVRTLFAQAGRRFTDSHEFHVERAAWEEQGIKFWPNSRFGIGVFSYFMLADELIVETKRLAQNGIDHEPGLRLVSVGSGSLLRLRRPDGVVPGTLVRLFLNDPELVGRFVPEIHDWLCLPEFTTVLVDANSRMEQLEAGRPTQALLEKTGPVAPVTASAGTNGQPRLFFWHKRERYSGEASNVLLVDGIRTTAPGEPPRDELPAGGVVLNLTEDLQPPLSMDRARLLSLDRAASWLSEQLRGGAFRHLLRIPFLQLEDLAFFSERPLVLVHLDRSLRNGSIPEPESHILAGESQLVLARVGLAPVIDQVILQRMRPPSGDDITSDRDDSDTFARVVTSRDRFAQAVGARLAALRRAGLRLQGAVFARLADFSAACGWVDAPTMALLLLSRRYSHSFSYQSETFSIAHRLEQLPFTDSELDDLAAQLDGWQEQKAFTAAIANLRARRERPESAQLIQRLRSLDVHPQEHEQGWRVTLVGVARASALTGRAPADIVAELGSIGWPALDYPQKHQLPAHPAPSALALLLLSPYRVIWNSKEPVPLLLRKTKEEGVIEALRMWGALAPELGWGDLAWAVVHWDMSRDAVRELVQPLEHWGVAVPGVSGPLGWVLDDPLLAHLLSSTTQESAESPEELNLAAVMRVARVHRERGVSFRDVRTQAARLTEYGVTVPELEHLPDELPADDRALRLWTADLTGKWPLLQSLTRPHLAKAALEWNVPLSEVAAIAALLEPWGVEIPDLNGADLDPRLLGRARELLSEKGGDDPPRWTKVVPLRQLLSAADEWAEPFEERLDVVRSWVSLLRDQPLSDQPIVPNPQLRQLLTHQSHLGWTDRVTSWDLTITAHEHHADPADYVEALEILARCGVNVDAALEFARFSG